MTLSISDTLSINIYKRKTDKEIAEFLNVSEQVIINYMSIRQNLERSSHYPDKDAGVHFCSRCNSNEGFFYRYFQDCYIKFCKVCNHGNYKKCPEAMPIIKISPGIIPLDHDKPWPTKDVLEKLIWATEYLLHEKDYGGHCHEELRICVNRGKEILLSL